MTFPATIVEDEVCSRSLSKLPAELLEIIALELDNDGLLSLRATCRNLWDGSALEFYRRFTTCEVEHSGHYLAVVFRSPDLARATPTSPFMSLSDVSIPQSVSRWQGHFFSRRSKGSGVLHGFAEALDDFTLIQKHTFDPRSKQDLSAVVTPAVTKYIASLHPSLTRLVLNDVSISGDEGVDALVKLFGTHRYSLRGVEFRKVDFDDAPRCFRALLQTEVEDMFLDGVSGRGEFQGEQLENTTWPTWKVLCVLAFSLYPDLWTADKTGDDGCRYHRAFRYC